MVKRWLAGVLTVLAVLGFAGCADDDGLDISFQRKTQTETETAEETTAEESYTEEDASTTETVLDEDTQTMYAESAVNVRSEASYTSEPLGQLDAGEEVSVASVSDGWAEIVYNGVTAYVSADYLTDAAQTTSAE